MYVQLISCLDILRYKSEHIKPNLFWKLQFAIVQTFLQPMQKYSIY